jgi:hypothetical protein
MKRWDEYSAKIPNVSSRTAGLNNLPSIKSAECVWSLFGSFGDSESLSQHAECSIFGINRNSQLHFDASDSAETSTHHKAYAF